MPKRKRSDEAMGRRRRRRRVYYRAKRRSRRVTNVTRSMSGAFPSATVAKLRFCDPIILDPNTGGIAWQSYRANSVWDPRAGVGGHQPRGFDEYMSLYSKFRVLGSKISCRFINDHVAQTSANEQSVVAFCGLVDDLADAPGNFIDTTEQRGKFTTRVLGNMQSAQFHKVIKRKFSAKKHWTGTPSVDEDIFEGGASADCLKQCFYIVGCGNYDLSENPSAVHVLVTIDYIVKFYQPKQLAQS